MHLRIGTRSSLLALQQTNEVVQRLTTFFPKISVEIIKIKTSGDLTEQPIYKIGGKGLFLKEIEKALLDGIIDIAVHSMKDVPSFLTTGLSINCVLPRVDPRDVFISSRKCRFESLASKSTIGTCSPRRKAQILKKRPDLNVVDIRGNINTRLRKLQEGQVDALVLAAAGFKRLNLEKHINHYFEINDMIPAGGQGAIGVQCRKNDHEIKETLEKINHKCTYDAVMCERLFLQYIDGTCNTPIGAYSEIKGNNKIILKTSYIEGSFEAYSAQEGYKNEANIIAKEAANDIIKLTNIKELKPI